MESKRHPHYLWVAFAALILLILAQNLVLLTYEPSVSGKATANISLCVNSPPNIDTSGCSNQSFVGTQYSCTLNVTDLQQSSFSYGVQRLSGSTAIDVMLVMPNATLSFLPNSSLIGNYTLEYTVDDLSGCLHSSNTATFPIEISPNNGAPYLVQPIPDRTWNANNLMLAYDLDDYFADPDLDPLVYSSNGTTNIGVSIASGQVLFTPANNWCGVEYVTFTATDPTNLSATSNVVTLTVNCVSSPSEDSTSTSSGGGGGSSGGGGSLGVARCYPNYACYDWSSCQLTRVVEPSTNSTRVLEITGVYGTRAYQVDANVTTDPNAYYTGFQYRECIDTRQCDETRSVTYVRPCEYRPSCSDGIQNQGETGVDCGGPCRACGSCEDGIQNGLETDVDCGGPLCPACNSCANGKLDGQEFGVDCGGPDCPACPSCSDSVKNQDETGVDCGGLFCLQCAEEQLPLPDGWPWLTLLLLTLIALVIGFVFATAIKRRLASMLLSLLLKHARHNRIILIPTHLKDDIIRRLAALEAQIERQPIIKSQEELARIIRDYFKAALELDFEFTNEELVAALKANRLDTLLSRIMQSFFVRINELEFSGVGVEPVVLRALIQETRELVYQTAVLTVDDLKEREADLQLRDIPQETPELDRAYLLLSQVHLCLQFRKLEVAGALYIVLHEWYTKAPAHEQHAIHNDFKRVYDEYVFATSRRL